MTDPTLTTALNGVLQQTVSRPGGVPGVVAMATDRNANFYEGAAGVRRLGGDDPMATDSVLAIFSTTKALTGTCVMQLVEEGRINLSDNAGIYMPELDALRVLSCCRSRRRWVCGEVSSASRGASVENARSGEALARIFHIAVHMEVGAIGARRELALHLSDKQCRRMTHHVFDECMHLAGLPSIDCVDEVNPRVLQCAHQWEVR